MEVRLAISGSPDRVPAVLRDLSSSGCFFSTTAPVKLGWTVSVSFLLKPRELCEAQGRVVRAQSGSGFGVQFESVNETMRKLVATLVAIPPGEHGWLLAALCDPEIEIGYLRRPAPGRQREPGSSYPSDCPKCGCKVPDDGPESCIRCGLTFDLWRPEETTDVAHLDERGEALWAEAIAGWDDPARHDAFLKHCSLTGLLPLAGRRYRKRLDGDPADTVAARMQERVLTMAAAVFVRPPPAAAAPVTRQPWFWGLLIVVAVGTVAIAASKRMTTMTPPRAAAPAIPGLAR
jgi:hypothetical protein